MEVTMSEDKFKVPQFRVPIEQHEAMERIAARNTPDGERVNVSLVYREAVRLFLAINKEAA